MVHNARERWLAHCCPAGHRPTSVRLSMTGRIKLRVWLPFVATQWIDTRRGFVWHARVGRWRVVISGSDRYLHGVGATDWKLWGRRELVAASGSDVTRSAAWRFAAEALTWLPSGCGDVSWREGPSDAGVIAIRQVGDEAAHMNLTIAGDGRLMSVTGPRWGNPLGNPFGYYPFGVDFHAETTSEGITVPSAFTARWFHGEPEQSAGEFFHARITEVRFGVAGPDEPPVV
jgi:hypothetical protein